MSVKALRRRAVWAVAVAALPAALALIVLGVDVLTVPRQVAADDVAFNATPRRAGGLWADVGLIPGGVGEQLLDIEDDLAYRRAVRLYLKAEPGRIQTYGPEFELALSRAQSALTTASREDPSPERRSQLLNLLGVLSFHRWVADPAERTTILKNGIARFRSAVEIHPGNSEAKLNLELALRDAGSFDVPGESPDRGAAQGRVSGEGRSGSGY